MIDIELASKLFKDNVATKGRQQSVEDAKLGVLIAIVEELKRIADVMEKITDEYEETLDVRIRGIRT